MTTVICLSLVLNIACSDSSDIVTKSTFKTVERFVEDFQQILDFRQTDEWRNFAAMTSSCFRSYVTMTSFIIWLWYNNDIIDFVWTRSAIFFHNFNIIFPQKCSICNFTLVIGFLDFPTSYWSVYPRTLWIWPWLWGRSDIKKWRLLGMKILFNPFIPSRDELKDWSCI